MTRKLVKPVKVKGEDPEDFESEIDHMEEE
jgi:hypothetical protein